jgi:hypothetical protein
MNRKTLIALAILSMFAASNSAVYADEEKQDAEKPQLIADEEKQDAEKPQLVA